MQKKTLTKTRLKEERKNQTYQDPEKIETLHKKEKEVTKQISELLYTHFGEQVAVEVGMKAFFEHYKNQRHKPLYESLPMFLYAACAMHLYLSVTKTIFWTTKHLLESCDGEELFITELSNIKLQFLEGLLQKVDKRCLTKNDLNFIGRDCKLLQTNINAMLENIENNLSGGYLVSDTIEEIKVLWQKWSMAARHLVAITPSKKQVDECEADCVDFFRYYAEKHKFGENVTWYMHYLKVHVPQYTKMYFEEFGWGYGVLTTQAMEHMLKQLKGAFKNTMHNKKKWEMVGKHLHQKHYGWYGKAQEKTKKRCSACGIQGHIRTNHNCPKYII